jgi:galactokinase
MKPSELEDRFRGVYGVPPRVFVAPGRVNLMGEHTDYNDGFVLPCAIGFFTEVAVSPRPDRKMVIRSENFAGEFEFALDQLPRRGTGQWCDYVAGVALALQDAGNTIRGANLLVRTSVPIGAGLSSSAALEVASALALLSLNGAVLPMPEIAKLCQRAENTFVGAQVGIMDQFVSCLGKAGHALLLDCRSLDFKLVPVPEHARIVICNTMVKHDLVTNEYNLRREQCAEGVTILSQCDPAIRALRDVSLEQLMQQSEEMPRIIYKRCLHVVGENKRVVDGAHRLATGDLAGFGELMRESHGSMRDLYQISCREVDIMVEAAADLPGCYGARMTGGGFGGCTVNLVAADSEAAFVAAIKERYERATAIKPDIYVCSAADGANALLQK